MGILKSLPPVVITPLKRIYHPKGDIFHVLKKDEISFIGFGEAYFTTIIGGEIKGWKKHTIMTMNIVVGFGKVRFYIHDEANNNTNFYDIGKDNYARLTIPPGYWVAFKGIESCENLVLNIASEAHNPNEAVNSPIETFSLA